MSKDNASEVKYLSDYSSKDQKWDFHKSASEKVEFFYSTSERHKRLGERMDSCAELLRYIFESNLTTGESELKLRDAHFCRVRLCPICQWRRSMSWRARLFQKLPSLLDENPSLRFLFLTLTIQNCEIDDLSKTLKVMNEGFARLRRLDKFKKVAQGFIRATEVTRSADGKAHPHFHCIIAVKNHYFTSRNYLKTEQWAELWQQSLRINYIPVVDVRKIWQKGSEVESKAIIETLKYTTKVEDLLADKEWFLKLTDQLFKKRFIATGGVLKDMLKEEVSEREMIFTQEEQISLDEEKIEELKQSLFFGFESKSQRYKKVKNPYEE